MASIIKSSDGMVENVSFTEEKKEEAVVESALKNPSVFTSTADEERTYGETPKSTKRKAY